MPQTNDYWPHAPCHKLSGNGAYMVTCGTYEKRHHLSNAEQLSYFQNALFETASHFSWRLQAWAILSNHYHFVAKSPAEGAGNLRLFMETLHGRSSKHLNDLDGTASRKVWYQYWDKRITYEKSYFPRLKYVNANPVHHGVANRAEDYRWCSAAWFEINANRAFKRTIERFKIDRLNVYDDF